MSLITRTVGIRTRVVRDRQFDFKPCYLTHREMIRITIWWLLFLPMFRHEELVGDVRIL